MLDIVRFTQGFWWIVGLSGVLDYSSSITSSLSDVPYLLVGQPRRVSILAGDVVLGGVSEVLHFLNSVLTDPIL